MNDLKKQIQKRKRKSFVAIILLVVVFIMGGTIAFFSSSIDFTNIFQTATYKTVTTEVFESPSNWTPGETVPKTITTTNEGSVDAMVRISLTEKWVDQDGNDITGSMPSDAAIINYTNQNEWNLFDGYYYYYKALEPGETTSTFISGVTLNPNLGNVTCTPSADGKTKTCEATNLGTKKKYRLTLKIETAQADKYKEIWDTEYEPPKYTVYNLSDIIYYDPVSDSTCDASTFNLTNVKEGTSTCYKWRVIETNDNQSSSTIKLQLDHDLVETAWGTSLEVGPDTSLTALANATSSWSKQENLNYTYDSSSYTKNYGTLTCTNGICSVNNNVIAGTSEKPLKARLMTREELLSIIQVEESASNCTFNTETNSQYFSTYSFVRCNGINSGAGNRTLSWLLENSTMNYQISGSTSNDYGEDNHGYYLLTPYFQDTYDFAYGIYTDTGYVTNWRIDDTFGLRPVVIASKEDVTLGNEVIQENVINTDSNNNLVYHPGDIVYFDPVTTNTCNSSTFDLTKVSRWQSFCFKFRVIETEDSSEKTDITLMLDHNIIVNYQNSNENDAGYILGFMGAANGPTSSWTRVPLLNYSYDTTINGHILGQGFGTLSCTNGLCKVIKTNKGISSFPNARVRMITPEEIDALNVYYGDTPSYTKLIAGGNNPDISINSNLNWLYENTTYSSLSNSTNNEYGDNNYGYWTMSPIINQSYGREYWRVYYEGKYIVSGIGNSGTGVRPVITVPKSYVTTE